MAQKPVSRMAESMQSSLAAAARPAGYSTIPRCDNCASSGTCFLGHFENADLAKLLEIRQTAWYPRGVVLFFEGEPARGIYVICSGEIKTFAHSAQGATVILRRVGQGEVLGISSSLSGSPYPVSAETLLPCQISFIPRSQFLTFLADHPSNYRTIIEALALQLQRSWEHTRILTLHRHIGARLAEMLLSHALQYGQDNPHGILVSLPLTQQDIADSIGTSRETVSRILSDLRKQGILRRRGNGFLIIKPRALQMLKDA